MSKILVVSDIDGCITKGQKITFETDDGIAVAKLFSDKDSYVASRIRDQLVFLTGDARVNLAWSAKHNVECMVADSNDKWFILKRYLEWRSIERFIYVGDCLPDYECLFHSYIGYIPADASATLQAKLQQEKVKHVYKLQVKGGDGVLDSVCQQLIDLHLLRPF